jgi:hypothetical protein
MGLTGIRLALAEFQMLKEKMIEWVSYARAPLSSLSFRLIGNVKFKMEAIMKIVDKKKQAGKAKSEKAPTKPCANTDIQLSDDELKGVSGGTNAIHILTNARQLRK